MKKPIPFGKYYLLERINVGGMAEVFRAKAFGVEGFERLVAVKRILPNIAEDKEFITMFVDEAKISVQLNHANIAQIFDLGVVENAYYIALEHIWGRDLRAIFERCRQRGEPMPVAQACFVMMKMCEGLDYAHNKRDAQGRDLNLVHRDVSPQNVLVSFEGEVKLIDFGIAKAAGKVGRTQQGILKGKFGYMSPEQVRGLPIDRRSDVFAVGIVLYEMLTGERLFVGESDFSTLEKVRNVEILPPSTYNRKIPDELERIVLKALAKDVDDRYQNAIDLHDELQAFVYTAGEFYSRKDLASWMKKTFVKEIQEETAKLETYRQLTPADTGERAGMTDSPARSERPERNDRDKRPTASRSSSAHVVPAAGANIRRTQQVSAVPPPLAPPPANGRSGRQTAQAMASGAQQVVSAGPSAKTMPPPVIDPTHELEWDEDELETQIYDTPGGAPPEDVKPVKSAKATASGVGPALKVVPRAGSGGAPGERAGTPALYPEPDPDLGVAATVREARGKQVEPPKTAAAGSGPRGTPKAEDTLAVRGTVIPDIKVRRPPSPLRIWLMVGAAAVAVGAIAILLTTGSSTPKKLSNEAAAEVAAADKPGDPAKAEKKDEPPAAPPLPVDPNSGFDLTTDPAGAKVRLDGNVIGVAPLRVRSLLAGKHTLEITAPSGTPTVTKEIFVDQGKWAPLNVKVDEASAAAAVAANAATPPSPQSQVLVKFTSDPSGAKVSLVGDGAKIVFGNTPFDAKVDMAHKYQALYELDGYTAQTKPIVVSGSDSTTTLAVTLVRERSASSAPVVTQVAAAVPVAPPVPPPVAPPPAKPHHEETPSHPKLAAVTPPSHESSHESSHEPAHEPRHSQPTPKETPDNPMETGAPDALPVTGGNGKLWIGAKPQCNIFLDGTDIGRTTPVRDLDVKSGTHTVTLVNAEFGIKEKVTVTVRAGEATKVIKDYSDRIPQ